MPAPPTAVQKADALAAQGRFAEAAGVLRGALERAPGDVPALTLLCRVLEQQGRAQEADAYIRKAIGLAPREERLYRVLGDLLTRSGRHAEAAELYRQWAVACPGSCWAQNS